MQGRLLPFSTPLIQQRVSSSSPAFVRSFADSRDFESVLREAPTSLQDARKDLRGADSFGKVMP